MLTGTPLENRLQELVSIVEFVDQHRLGPTFRFLHDHQVCDEVGRVVGYRDLDRIGRPLAPILLRRRKAEVLAQLPERLERRLFVPMTPEQTRHHEENREIVARLVARWRRYRFLSEADQRRLTIALQAMRMACDSTYLLDRATDHGTKAEELMALLEELLAQPDTKVVIFSQWVRMHEVLSRRLSRRRWAHVVFHGGVETAQRKGLVDRFREDPRCRLFLSTDAGGVGLNLQHASVVVNVDLPWNPAVLEQRIGRVHRLGQRRPVQVVNLVAKGTIEEGMLSLLGFKRSLFSGVLDDGAREVFLGGHRLERFMESVGQVTAAIPARAEAEALAPPEPAARAVAEGGDAAADGALAGPNGLAALVRTGLQILDRFVAASQPGAGAERAGAGGAGPAAVEPVRDEQTGQAYLKIRMPQAEVLERVARSLHALLESVAR